MVTKHKQLDNALLAANEELNEAMLELLPEIINSTENKVVKAMHYSSLSEGKKLRPFLVLVSANLFGVSTEAALRAACAIEFIHVYSLIHDDLPAMDNDDLRRGVPSCHKEFDEATAILAGDGLLTLAFEILSHKDTHVNASIRCELISRLAAASGTQGMVGGQMMDITCEHKNLTIPEIIHLQRMKTGALFGVSCETGAILGKASDRQRRALRGYAHDIGLAFQITDDLLDTEGNSHETGKAVRKDKSSGKATIVAKMGINKAKAQAIMLKEQAYKHLEIFDERADLLRQLADFVINRKN